jgi:hypothetical protein
VQRSWSHLREFTCKHSSWRPPRELPTNNQFHPSAMWMNRVEYSVQCSIGCHFMQTHRRDPEREVTSWAQSIQSIVRDVFCNLFKVLCSRDAIFQYLSPPFCLTFLLASVAHLYRNMCILKFQKYWSYSTVLYGRYLYCLV